ncbi:hypothetical protein ACIQSO_16005 [Pseudomonas putida]|uniref:hypothetical protein n=1 Tax=Pseudomonas putida TaxID=303 RepID=UPI00383BA58C
MTKSYSDNTDFEGKDPYNGWHVPQPISDYASIELHVKEGKVLEFPSMDAKPDGVVLRKQYGHVPQGNYEFVLRASNVGECSPARISIVYTDGSGGRQYILEETDLGAEGRASQWHDYRGSLAIPDAAVLTVEIDNHNPSSEGNHYQFSKLILRTHADITDFEGDSDAGRLNGWRLREDYRKEFPAMGNEGHVLYLHTHPEVQDHTGIFLSKSYSSLALGKQYKFEMRLALSHPLAPPTLEVKCGGVQVIKPTELSGVGEWQELCGTFEVVAECTDLTIENHTKTSRGNDFHISELRVFPV